MKPRHAAGSISVLSGCLLVLLSAGCVKPVPLVAIPGSDASPPTLAWQTYNVVTKERKDIVQDGQTVEVSGSDQYVVTFTVEDQESGVKDAALTGHVHYKCELGGQVTDDKKFDLEPQETKTIPNHENQVAVSAALTYVVEFNRRACKELETFGGGTLSLTGKGHNSLNSGGMKTLRMNLKRHTGQ
ncbi:MAG: hypothetical protein QM706_00605 [Nitrospira sp.]